MKRNSKKLILIALLFAATFMGAGYSLLQQQLKIQGNINVKTNFDVKITGIQKYENSGYYVANAGAFYIKDVTEVAEPTFTATTATFNVRMEPESKITYVITVKNSGTMPAIIESAVEEKEGNADIIVETPVIFDDSFLDMDKEVKYLVTLSYDYADNMSEETDTTVTITFNAKQAPAYGEATTINPLLIFAENAVFEGIGYSTRYGVNILNGAEGTPAIYESVDDGEYALVGEQNSIIESVESSYVYFNGTSAFEYFPSSELGSGLHTIKLKASYENGTLNSNEVTLDYYIP